MTTKVDPPVRAGGQALADGVLMRTERAWAIARIDGSIETGAVPENRFAAVPVLRVLAGLFSGLKLGLVRGLFRPKNGPERTTVRRSRKLNRRFLLVLVGAEGVVALLTYVIGRFSAPHWADVLLTLLPWTVVLLVLRVAAPSALWRYHGAEHKAVTAHERGLDLDDVDAVMACSRVHDRCGTNLVFVMALASLALMSLPHTIQIPTFLVTLGIAVELVTVASKRPRLLGSRIVLAGGHFLQRQVTTQEPTPEEQAVGCKALQAALAEHHRLESAELETIAA